MGPVLEGRPLPLDAAGSIEINHACRLLETNEGGAVFIHGMAAWCFESDDVIGRRLAAVQLIETRAATPTQVATAFGVDFETVRRWRKAWQNGGVAGLVPRKHDTLAAATLAAGDSPLTERYWTRSRSQNQESKVSTSGTHNCRKVVSLAVEKR